MEEEHKNDKEKDPSLFERAKQAVEGTGKLIVDGLNMAGQGGLYLVKGGFSLGGKIIHAGLLIKDGVLREKFGLTYFESLVKENWPKIKQELENSKYLAFLLWKTSKGELLTEDEQQMAKKHLKNLAKTVPALGIFALPGGMILLPLLAKALPWNILPDSFRKEKKEEVNQKESEEKVPSTGGEDEGTAPSEAVTTEGEH